jgi:alkylation response protein AidB-like acyl-CoA dehydrogenase
MSTTSLAPDTTESMDSEEFSAFTAGTKKFVLEKLRPLEEQLEEQDGLDPELWAELGAISRDLGLFNANIPMENGGSGLTLPQFIKTVEIFGQTSWPFTYLLGKPNPLLLRGTPEQQEEYLQPVMSGQKTQAFALTEPEAGSFTSGIKTRAEKVKGGWRITGNKHFISNGSTCDFAIVIAVTGQTKSGRPEATAFLVDRKSEGFHVTRRQEGIGFRGMEQNELFFEDCFVPEDKVLGSLGDGLDYGFGFIAERRLFLSGYCVGVMERLVQLSIDFLASRTAFGGPLLDKQGLRWRLADMEAEFISAQSVVYAAAERSQSILRSAPGELPVETVRAAVKDVSIAKLLATTGVNRSADAAVQLHGGVGWSKGSAVERIFRDVRATRIMDGTDEIHREIISRELARRVK